MLRLPQLIEDGVAAAAGLSRCAARCYAGTSHSICPESSIECICTSAAFFKNVPFCLGRCHSREGVEGYEYIQKICTVNGYRAPFNPLEKRQSDPDISSLVGSITSQYVPAGTSVPTQNSDASDDGSGLTQGATAAVSIGAILIIVLLCVIVWWCTRRRWRRKHALAAQSAPTGQAIPADDHSASVSTSATPRKLSAPEQVSELDTLVIAREEIELPTESNVVEIGAGEVEEKTAPKQEFIAELPSVPFSRVSNNNLHQTDVEIVSPQSSTMSPGTGTIDSVVSPMSPQLALAAEVARAHHTGMISIQASPAPSYKSLAESPTAGGIIGPPRSSIEKARKIDVLLDRMDRIRTEKDRLMRIQELGDMEKTTQAAILEEQKKMQELNKLEMETQKQIMEEQEKETEE